MSQSPGGSVELRLPPARRLTVVLWWLIAALTVVNGLAVAVRYKYTRWDYKNLTDLFLTDAEANLPTVLATALLGLTAFLAYLKAKIAPRLQRRGWVGVAVVCAYLAIDESAGLHERVGDVVKDRLGDAGGWLEMGWVLPGAIVVVVLAVWTARWRSTLDPQARRALTMAAGVFVVGALGMEVLAALWVHHVGQDLNYGLVAATEELLETIGVMTLLTYLAYDVEQGLRSVTLRTHAESTTHPAEDVC